MMGLGIRHQPSERKPYMKWNPRLRDIEGDDNVDSVSHSPVITPVKLSREFVDKTAAMLQKNQDSARNCPRNLSTSVNSGEDARLAVSQNYSQSQSTLRKTLDRPQIVDEMKQDESCVTVARHISPKTTNNISDDNTVTARLSPATPPSQDVWIISDERWDGQLSTENGQLGRWRCGAPYTSLGTWVFVPLEKPAPKGKVSQSRKHNSKAILKTSFLSLPGELRNEVYKYLIPECRILITCNKPNKELTKVKNVWSEQNVKHKRPRSRLCHLLDLNQAEQGLGITKNLLSVCKRVREDVELYLYSRTTFCFSSTKVLHRFLNTASKPGLKVIESLEILHKGYGLPELTEHQHFQDKYYEQWSKVCIQIGEKLSNLKHLKLEAHMKDWPCDLTSAAQNTPWRKACLQMAPRRLLRVEVKLFHQMIHLNDMVLKDLARSLEDDMMTQDGQNKRDHMETERVLNELAAQKAVKEARAAARAAKLRAPEPLTITQEDIRRSNPISVKVCKKGGLGNYSKVNVAELCTAELESFKDQYCSERHKSALTRPVLARSPNDTEGRRR